MAASPSDVELDERIKALADVRATAAPGPASCSGALLSNPNHQPLSVQVKVDDVSAVYTLGDELGRCVHNRGAPQAAPAARVAVAPTAHRILTAVGIWVERRAGVGRRAAESLAAGAALCPAADTGR